MGLGKLNHGLQTPLQTVDLKQFLNRGKTELSGHMWQQEHVFIDELGILKALKLDQHLSQI